MTLLLPDGGEFTTGVCPCASRAATEGERLTRLFVPVLVEGIATDAVVDTGGAYLIPDTQTAARLGLDPDDALGAGTLRVRGTRYHGTLHRVSLTFPALTGDDVTIEATAFVPDLSPSEVWPLPTYLGWQGCLERLRFAVDPVAELFFFGPP